MRDFTFLGISSWADGLSSSAGVLIMGVHARGEKQKKELADGQPFTYTNIVDPTWALSLAKVKAA